MAFAAQQAARPENFVDYVRQLFLEAENCTIEKAFLLDDKNQVLFLHDTDGNWYIVSDRTAAQLQSDLDVNEDVINAAEQRKFNIEIFSDEELCGEESAMGVAQHRYRLLNNIWLAWPKLAWGKST